MATLARKTKGKKVGFDSKRYFFESTDARIAETLRRIDECLARAKTEANALIAASPKKTK